MSCPAKQAVINKSDPKKVVHGNEFFSSLTHLAASVICSSTLLSVNEARIK